MTFCRKFFAKQFTWTTSTTSKKRTTKSYSFPSGRSRTTRRYHKAA